MKQTYKKSIAEPFESLPNDTDGEYFQAMNKKKKAEEFFQNFPGSVRNDGLKRSYRKGNTNYSNV